MANTYLLIRDAADNSPKGDGVDAALIVAATSDDAKTAAKALSAGDLASAWDGATVVDLGDGGLTAGAAAFAVKGTITEFE